MPISFYIEMKRNIYWFYISPLTNSQERLGCVPEFLISEDPDDRNHSVDGEVDQMLHQHCVVVDNVVQRGQDDADTEEHHN